VAGAQLFHRVTLPLTYKSQQMWVNSISRQLDICAARFGPIPVLQRIRYQYVELVGAASSFSKYVKFPGTHYNIAP
jgi:hypothetical protein